MVRFGGKCVGGVPDRDDVARAQHVVAVDRADSRPAELAGVDPLPLGELVDQIDIAVGAVDDQRRLARLVAVAPLIPLVDDPAHRLGASVVQLERVVLLEDRYGGDSAAFVDGDLVVAQPRVNLLGVVGVAVAADLPQLCGGDPLVAQHFREQPGRRIASCCPS